MVHLQEEKVLLIFLLLIAALLRLYQIHFGAPFLYHPDEIKLVAQAGRLLSTHFADLSTYFAIGTYPPFFTYLLTVPFALYILVNLLSGRFASLAEAKIFYDMTPFPFFLMGRLLVAFMGVASVWLLYRIVMRLYGKRVAWIAAVLLAVNFTHVQHSHYATVDLPASFFTLLAVYGAVLLLEKPKASYYLVSGLAAAMALASKFSMLFAILPALYAHGCQVYESGWSWRALWNRRLLLLVIAAVVGFLLFCPLFILDFSRSQQGLVETGQFEKEGKLGSGGSLFSYWSGDQSQGFGVFYPNDLPSTFGLVLMGFCLAGLVVMLIRHRRSDLLLLSIILPTYFMFEYVAYKAIRHLLPVVPFFLLAAAIAIDGLAERLFSRGARRLALLIGVLLGLVAIQLQRTTHYFNELSKPDPRTLARSWILQHLPDRSRIMTESFPPALPNCRDAKPGETICYQLASFKMTSRRLHLQETFKATLRDSMIQYYIADGFTRAFFDWKYSDKKYPQVVQERKEFFSWLEAHSQRLQTFRPDDPAIQPEIIIYQLPSADPRPSGFY